jgi:hypothetical protein
VTRPGVYAKRPSTVEAWQWDGTDECAALITDWIESNRGFAEKHPHEDLIILGNDVDSVKPTDWVIRDKFGEFWPLPAVIFPAVYASLT